MTAESQVREIDLAIDTAVSERDAATLERWLAGDFVYTHAGGTAEAKREFIATAVARADPPRRGLLGHTVEVHDDVAVSHGVIEFVYADGRPTLRLGFVRVHRLRNGDWRAISHCSFYVIQEQT